MSVKVVSLTAYRGLGGGSSSDVVVVTGSVVVVVVVVEVEVVDAEVIGTIVGVDAGLEFAVETERRFKNMYPPAPTIAIATTPSAAFEANEGGRPPLELNFPFATTTDQPEDSLSQLSSRA